MEIGISENKGRSWDEEEDHCFLNLSPAFTCPTFTAENISRLCLGSIYSPFSSKNNSFETVVEDGGIGES